MVLAILKPVIIGYLHIRRKVSSHSICVAPDPVPSGYVCLGSSGYDVLAGNHGFVVVWASGCAEHVLGSCS